MAKNLDQDSSLPYSIEAEKAVLGGIMLKNDTWDLVAGLVIEDDFYQDEHKLIYRTINSLQELGKPVDVITVQETLESPSLVHPASCPHNLSQKLPRLVVPLNKLNTERNTLSTSSTPVAT